MGTAAPAVTESPSGTYTQLGEGTPQAGATGQQPYYAAQGQNLATGSVPLIAYQGALPIVYAFMPAAGSDPVALDTSGAAPQASMAMLDEVLPVTQSGESALPASLSGFVQQWTNRLVDTQATPGAYQCVDLANQYCDQVLGPGHRVPCADACQMLDNANPAQYTAVSYAPGRTPSPGDLVIWGSDLSGSSGAGHVDICLSSNAAGFTGFDQNWGTNNASPCREVQHDYSHVIGWLHPTGQ
jgi:hypothetical protein